MTTYEEDRIEECSEASAEEEAHPPFENRGDFVRTADGECDRWVDNEPVTRRSEELH